MSKSANEELSSNWWRVFRVIWSHTWRVGLLQCLFWFGAVLLFMGKATFFHIETAVTMSVFWTFLCDFIVLKKIMNKNFGGFSLSLRNKLSEDLPSTWRRALVIWGIRLAVIILCYLFLGLVILAAFRLFPALNSLLAQLEKFSILLYKASMLTAVLFPFFIAMRFCLGRSYGSYRWVIVKKALSV